MHAMRALPVLLAASCATLTPLDQTLSSDGDPIEITSFRTEIVSANDPDAPDAVIVRLSLENDPICNAADDERAYIVSLLLPDPAAVTLGSPIDLSQADGPVEPDLLVSCFCPAPEEDDAAEWAGTVTFTELSDTTASLALDARFEGITTIGESEVVEIEGDFDVPDDRASSCNW